MANFCSKILVWWKDRTKLERILTLLICISILICIALLISLIAILCPGKSSSTDDEKSPENKTIETVCMTSGCVHAASLLLKQMDFSVDPCDDFYQFTCGQFLKNTVIPDDKAQVTGMTIADDLVQGRLRTIIEEPMKERDLKPFKLMKKLYKACMNKDKIETLGLDNLKATLKDVGGWPVLEAATWAEGDFDWKKTIQKLIRLGYHIDYFFSFAIDFDVKNNTKWMIELAQPLQLGTSRNILAKGAKDSEVADYFDNMVDIAVIFGADKNRAKTELKESLNLEMKLANIMSSRRSSSSDAKDFYNPMAISEIQEKFPTFSWLEFLNTVMEPDAAVSSRDIVNFLDPEFFGDLETLIKSTPKRVQANYLMWRMIASVKNYLPVAIRKLTVPTPELKECVWLAGDKLPIAVGALYVRKFVKKETKASASEMMTHIQAALEDILESSDWMDEKTRKKALEKAYKMHIYVAYPDELNDDKILEKFYKNLDLDEDQYLKSILNLTIFDMRSAYRNLRQKYDKTSWERHSKAFELNAFFSPQDNSVVLPAGILQGIFFDETRPQSMNYGALGFVVGHEMLHGFDTLGRQFDKYGNLKDWWEPQTAKAFQKKTQSLINQYGNFTVPEIDKNINGVLTLSENIADNGGMKEAYEAFRNWREENGGNENILPGLKYNERQLFWIAAATVWCGKFRDDQLLRLVKFAEHSPGKYRIIGTLRNMESFAEDFNCPLGSKMNPKIKNGVW